MQGSILIQYRRAGPRSVARMSSKTPPCRSMVRAEAVLSAAHTSSTRWRPSWRACWSIRSSAQLATPRPRAEGRTPYSDVPTSVKQGLGELVAQRDAAEDLPVLNDPPVGAGHPPGRTTERIGLASQPRQPGREACGGIELIAGKQPEPVLMGSWPPLLVRVTPWLTQPLRRRDEIQYGWTVPSSPAPADLPCPVTGSVAERMPEQVSQPVSETGDVDGQADRGGPRNGGRRTPSIAAARSRARFHRPTPRSFPLPIRPAGRVSRLAGRRRWRCG